MEVLGFLKIEIERRHHKNFQTNFIKLMLELSFNKTVGNMLWSSFVLGLDRNTNDLKNGSFCISVFLKGSLRNYFLVVTI